ncbi:trk family cation uptake protein [Aerococcus urinaehominis]|uniref:Trk family cation uptake protein n=2 Tax=Aerococcus urinaehominis TaxID=128944 RepID=A0A0X8FML7_9LACT|nr:trk family cation uptake protein [Aerococcus urinaehominis]
MNLDIIRYLIGRLLMVLGLLMIPSVAVSLYFDNSHRVVLSFLIAMVLCWAAGAAISFRPLKNSDFFAKEGLALVSLSWMVIALFGALPFYISGAVPSYIDALFESVSGFTTTGASVLGSSLTALPEGLLFWRSFTLMVGGMGMLIFILYILPNLGAKGVYIMRAELPGPVFGKVESRVSSTIYILYIIYLLMTVAMTILLRLGGVAWFEAMLLAMGASGTGGFNVHANSIAYYDSTYIELVLTAGMFIFGMNFNFFYLIYEGKWRQVLKNEEFKWYVGIVLACVALIMLNVWPQYQDLTTWFTDVIFNVSSVMSTTAYTNMDLTVWPVFSQIILLFLMFSGAMSGSTTSGLKVARVAIFIKAIYREVHRLISPSRVVPLTFDGKVITKGVLYSVCFYLITYLGVFLTLMLVLSLDVDTFASAFNATIATLSNIGGSLDLLGPADDYALLSKTSKLVMCLGMIMGRLEIYPVLILFSRRTWQQT